MNIYIYIYIYYESYTLTITGDTHSLYNLMWRWCGQDKWRVKSIPAWHWESFLGFTRLGFYLKRCPAYSIKGWEAVSLNLRSLDLATAVAAVVFVVVTEAAMSILDHRRSPPSMVSHRHSPPQPLSHEIFLMQMGALDSYHVANLKFRYLKSNCALS